MKRTRVCFDLLLRYYFAMDPFNTLQDIMQKKHGTKPEVISCTGSQHTGFTVAVKTPWGVFEGVGNRKVQARTAAALLAVQAAGVNPDVVRNVRLKEPLPSASPPPYRYGELLRKERDLTETFDLLRLDSALPPPLRYRDPPPRLVTGPCIIHPLDESFRPSSPFEIIDKEDPVHQVQLHDFSVWIKVGKPHYQCVDPQAQAWVVRTHWGEYQAAADTAFLAREDAAEQALSDVRKQLNPVPRF